ncbi:hypothetical protein EIK56_14380 [Sphingomonas sp. C8-2]|nr:hypothetical protein EIK56_14380 [Sphingomonas sp. C8-2]
MAFARLNPGGGLWKLYNDLDATYRRADPEVVDVTDAKVNVVQAYYDRTMGRLAVAMLPEGESTALLRFGIRNLDRSIAYKVQVDGKDIGTVRNGIATSSDPSVKLKWGRARKLVLEMPMGTGRQITIDQTARKKQ